MKTPDINKTLAQDFQDDLDYWGSNPADVIIRDENGERVTDLALTPVEVRVMFTALRDYYRSLSLSNTEPDMTIYASKTPRDLNHDPKPWAHGDIRAARPRYEHIIRWLWDARPEFDHVQHNEPNPILLAFRQDVADVFVAEQFNVAAIARSWIDGDALELFADMHPNEVLDHARRVLTRLANLSQIGA